MDGMAIELVNGFLTLRKMRVDFSSWADVLSGVPRGSVLVPILYVNDIADWMTNSIRLFADDTKIWNKVTVLEDAEGLQQDLQRLENWSDKWLLHFNAEKCKVMHVGHNTKTKYFLQDNGLTTELEEFGKENSPEIVFHPQSLG